MMCNYSKGIAKVNNPEPSHGPEQRADLVFSRRLKQSTRSYAQAGPAFLLPRLHRTGSLMPAS